MPSLTCIVCPVGCQLTVGPAHADPAAGESLEVTGNRCPRGAAYALEEVRSPKRVVTATCAIAGQGAGGADAALRFPECRRVPVKTSAPCPKDQIPALLADIYALRVSPPVKSGDALITGWRGTGIDVVAVRTLG